MSGLSEIVNGILNSADEEVKNIKAEAEKAAQEIIKQAQFKAENEKNELLKKAEAEVKKIEKNTVDTAAAEKRLTLLSAKQEIVKNMLHKAKNKLLELNGEEYENIVLALFEKNVKSGECIAYFAENDGFSEDFFGKIKKLAEKADCSLTVKTDRKGFTKGFILAYPGEDGEKLENCSFEMLFDSNLGTLSDRAAEILFK